MSTSPPLSRQPSVSFTTPPRDSTPEPSRSMSKMIAATEYTSNHPEGLKPPEDFNRASEICQYSHCSSVCGTTYRELQLVRLTTSVRSFGLHDWILITAPKGI